MQHKVVEDIKKTDLLFFNNDNDADVSWSQYPNVSCKNKKNTKKSPGQGPIFKTTFKIQDDPGIQIINRIGEKVAGSGHPIHFYLVSESGSLIHF